MTARAMTANSSALSFLVLIGTNLLAEGFGVHVSKGSTYLAMAFSVAGEMLNLRLRKNAKRAVHLRERDYQTLADG
jgi:predicted tellurium resistance membrane protein TerC